MSTSSSPAALYLYAIVSSKLLLIKDVNGAMERVYNIKDCIFIEGDHYNGAYFENVRIKNHVNFVSCTGVTISVPDIPSINYSSIYEDCKNKSTRTLLRAFTILLCHKPAVGCTAEEQDDLYQFVLDNDLPHTSDDILPATDTESLKRYALNSYSRRLGAKEAVRLFKQ